MKVIAAWKMANAMMLGQRMQTSLFCMRCDTASMSHKDTTAPEYRWHPPRSHLLGAERGNPAGVRLSR